MSTGEKPMGEKVLVPPLKKGCTTRNIIFLFDGTGDTVDDDVTNVVKFAQTLYSCPKEGKKVIEEKEPIGSPEQVMIYRRGIGTGSQNGIIDTYLPTISKSLDKAIAWNFENHVIRAYETLVKTYKEGDKISLFGFSRGAYTARAVAAVITAFGLLKADAPKEDFETIQEIYFAPSRNHYLSQAYHLVKDRFSSEESDVGPFSESARQQFMRDAAHFRDSHHNTTQMVNIDFLGVWDTVNSVGIVSTAEAMLTSSNSNLRILRHAIALDERRARFDRAMWRIESDAAVQANQPNLPPNVDQIEQVWFAGAHCDVGGGSVKNHVKHALANIPLRWMIRECFKTNTGIIFDHNELEGVGLDSTSLYPMVKPRPAALPLRGDAVLQYAPSRWSWPFHSEEKSHSKKKTEEEHDHDDVLTPIYDQLEIGYYSWNLLEIVPVKKWNSVTRKQTRARNWWNGRVIDVHINKVDHEGKELPEKEWKRLPPIKVHHTVKMRMDAKGGSGKGKYIPAAILDLDGGQKLRTDIGSDLVEWVY